MFVDSRVKSRKPSMHTQNIVAHRRIVVCVEDRAKHAFIRAHALGGIVGARDDTRVTSLA